MELWGLEEVRVATLARMPGVWVLHAVLRSTSFDSSLSWLHNIEARILFLSYDVYKKSGPSTTHLLARPGARVG